MKGSLGAIAVVLVVVSGCAKPSAPASDEAAKVRERVTELSKSKTEAVQDFIATNDASADPKVQDLVSVARAQLAFRSAANKDFEAARAQFQQTAQKHKGTKAESADWGGIADQAVYQAAACLVAEGKTEEAKAEFVRFMTERPMSPLVHAVHKRLVKMDPANEERYNDLLQVGIAKQEARIRFETSVCGPRTIAYLLEQGQLSGQKTDYKELAKLCGTSDDGTTVEGMRKGLRTIGIESYAYKLNRQDLARAALPMILLEGDHYVALTKLEGDSATLYDTRFRSERTLRLPPIADPDFFVNAILFQPLEVQP